MGSDAEAALLELAALIEKRDEGAALEARRRWDAIAHPLGGLGLLEEAVCRMAGAQGTPDAASRPRALAVFFADNGVVAEGVSQSGQEVTALVARNMALGLTSSCRMAAEAGCKVVAVDVGVTDGRGAAEAFDGAAGEGTGAATRARMVSSRVRSGTGNIAQGAAMTREEAARAVLAGASCAQEMARGGAKVLLAGEMGIGNTTTSAAVASALLGVDPDSLVGRGAGLDDESLERKRRTVARALRVNEPDPACALDVLAKVGGLDIAALCGFYLGAAQSKCPAVLDGVISCTAALAAARLAPAVRGYLLASHRSTEPAAALLLDELGLAAPIHAGMHLGEGTGALSLLPLLDLALSVYEGGRSFADTGMTAYEHLGGRS